MATSDMLKPVHPGRILQEEFLEPMGLSQNKAALAMRVPARRINEIVHGKRSITPDTAIRLGLFFGMSPEFWVNLQARYDLESIKGEMGEQLQKEVQPLSDMAA